MVPTFMLFQTISNFAQPTTHRSYTYAAASEDYPLPTIDVAGSVFTSPYHVFPATPTMCFPFAEFDLSK